MAGPKQYHSLGPEFFVVLLMAVPPLVESVDEVPPVAARWCRLSRSVVVPLMMVSLEVPPEVVPPVVVERGTAAWYHFDGDDS